VRELTGGRGVDQVVDTGGGTLEQSIQSTTLEGQVNFVGRSSGRATAINVDTLYTSVATVRVVFAGSRAHIRGDEPGGRSPLNRLQPVIDRVFPFDDVSGAFEYYETGQSFGKVVISHM
jgi:NADPH:quinone reductase-like Zn-dependent oxidoreductase